MKVEIRTDKVMQDGIGIATKPDAVGDLITTITLKTQMDAGAQARLVNLLKQKCPKFIVIGSEQAQMDLFAVGITSQGALDALVRVSETGEIPDIEKIVPDNKPVPQCPHGGDEANDCGTCLNGGEYMFWKGECVLRAEITEEERAEARNQIGVL